jgi:hypothetical protein
MRGWLNRARLQRPVRPHRRIGKVWFKGRPSMMLGWPCLSTSSIWRDDSLRGPRAPKPELAVENCTDDRR